MKKQECWEYKHVIHLFILLLILLRQNIDIMRQMDKIKWSNNMTSKDK